MNRCYVGCDIDRFVTVVNQVVSDTPCLLVTSRTAQALGGLCGERDVGTSTSQAREIAPMWERACRQPRSAKQEISGNEPELAGHANIA